MTIALSDKRFPLIKLLERYKPSDEADAAQRDRILEFVQRNGNCFERSNLAGHITGSAWIVNKTQTNVLLTHHKKLNKWLQLGGHADGQSDVLQAALREAREESGLTNLRVVSPDIFDVDVHPIPERANEPAHYHYDIRFLLQATTDEEPKINDESNKLEWVELDKISNYSNEKSLLQMALKMGKQPRI